MSVRLLSGYVVLLVALSSSAGHAASINHVIIGGGSKPLEIMNTNESLMCSGLLGAAVRRMRAATRRRATSHHA